MLDYAMYNGTTGEITQWGQLDETSIALQTVPTYIGLVDPKTQYIDVQTGSPVTRPDFPSAFDRTTIVANGTDQTVITGLPNPTRVSFVQIDAGGVNAPAAFNVTDGILNLRSGAKGYYVISLNAFPYREYVVGIQAV